MCDRHGTLRHVTMAMHDPEREWDVWTAQEKIDTRTHPTMLHGVLRCLPNVQHQKRMCNTASTALGSAQDCARATRGLYNSFT